MSVLNRRNKLILSAVSRDSGELPSEYQQVEYLESSGDCWIDTLSYLSGDSKVEIKGYLSNLTSTSLIGYNPYFVITSTSSYIRFRYNSRSIDTAINKHSLHEIVFDRNIVYVDEVKKAEFVYSAFETNRTALLFARRAQNGAVEEAQPNARVYYCRIYDDDVLVRNFIPCYRKLDKEIGLFDTVSKRFFTNSGTGTFIKGGEING